MACCNEPRLSPAWIQDRYSYMRCLNCGLISLSPLPDASELDTYYQTQYEVPHTLFAGASTSRVHLVERLLRYGELTKGALLEVGASHGYTAQALTQCGWSVRGIEISVSASQFAREKLGMDVRQGQLSDYVLEWAGAFDGLYSVHVLEHIPDVETAIRDMYRCLKPGGVLQLTVPNGGSLRARLLRDGWEWSCPPAHIHLFTPKSLQSLLERCGFHLLHIETERGDACGVLLDAARTLHKRLKRRASMTPTEGVTSVPNSPRYPVAVRMLERASDWLRPFARLVDGRLLGPQLNAVAYRD